MTAKTSQASHVMGLNSFSGNDSASLRKSDHLSEDLPSLDVLMVQSKLTHRGLTVICLPLKP